MSGGIFLIRKGKAVFFIGACIFLFLMTNFYVYNPTQIIINDNKTPLYLASALFDGLYVKWNGTNAAKLPWSGNESIIQTGPNFFRCTEYSTTFGWDWRGINDITRIVNGSDVWGFGDNKHEWLYIFTNVKLNDTVPVIVANFENQMNVSGEADVRNDYLGATFNCWKLTDTNGSLVFYDKGTGLLIKGTFKYFNGTASYSIIITATNEPFTNNFAPSLESGQVFPSTGNTSTYFTYSVNYTDADDNPPNSINVIIDGNPYTMTKLDPADHNYTDGCIYTYTSLLSNVSHTHYFNATDSSNNVRLPIAGFYSGPSVNYFNTHIPELRDGKVIPLNGNTYQEVIFQVNYSDRDNDPPSYVNVTINTTSYSLQKKNPLDNIYLDGCIYEHSLKLFEGNYTFHFNASDGKNNVWAPTFGNYGGPYIQQVNWAFKDDVESGKADWTTIGTPSSSNTTGWHIVTTDYKSPIHTWWCGDDGTGKTGNNWNVRLVSPLINLTGAYFVNFSFYHKYYIEDYFDFGYVEIQVNGTSPWNSLLTITGTQATWTQVAADISEYAGNYVYICFRFQSDEAFGMSGWYIDDITVDVLGNFYIPTLTGASTAPSTGNTSTLFQYWITYTDFDNNPPVNMQVIIDGVAHSMVKYIPSDFNYQDGCLYYYSTYLTNITHAYYFIASDGVYNTRSPPSENYSGPLVNLKNLVAPILGNASVSPIEDLYFRTFTFRVTYIDSENQAPTYMNVTINGTAYQMAKETLSDNIYLDGVVYIYAKTMPTDGIYTYHFNASDGFYSTRFPSDGEFMGPYTVLYDMTTDIPYANSLHNVTNPINSYKQYFEADTWGGFGLRPVSDINVDLELFGNYSYSGSLVESLATDNRVNLLMYCTSGEPSAKYYYLQASIQRGIGSYRIESDNPPTLPAIQYIADENFTEYFNPNEVMQVCLFAGQEIGRAYNLTVNVPGNMDIDAYIFNNTGVRKDAIACSRNIGNGVAESLLFRLTSSSNFTIVFTNENGGSGFFTYNITTDLAAPTALIESPLNKTYNLPLINVSLSCLAPDLHTMWYRVRNLTTWIITNVTWISGSQLNLADGIYTLYAWANDTGGNIQAQPSQRMFIIDTSPPIAIISSPKAITYFTNTIQINLTSFDLDVHSFWYRIYDRIHGIWLDQTNVIWSDNITRYLPEGNYSLFAWVNDTAGNTQNGVVSVNFTINTPPIIQIVTPENRFYQTPTIPVEVTTNATDISSIWYRFHNGTNWITSNITWSIGSYETLSDGTYSIFVWGNDSRGLISNPVIRTFSIDITAPEIFIVSPLNATYHILSVLINFSCTSPDLSLMWYRIFTISGMSWLDPMDIIWGDSLYRNFSDGSYMLCLWANDTLGNRIQAPLTLNFTVDAPPTLNSISIPNGTVSLTGRLLLNISVDAADLDAIWYRIFDGKMWITGTTLWTNAVILQLENGNYSIYIWINDTQGNQMSYVVSFSIRITPTQGWDFYIWISIIIGVIVTGVAIFYRIKKLRRKKSKIKKAKGNGISSSQNFAERVLPKAKG